MYLDLETALPDYTYALLQNLAALRGISMEAAFLDLLRCADIDSVLDEQLAIWIDFYNSRGISV